MDIINITPVSAGNSAVDWFFFILLCAMGVFVIVGACFMLFDKSWGASIAWFFIGLAIIGAAVFILRLHRITEPYNTYTVLFNHDEKIDMVDFLEKYKITGHDGNIWYLEDVH